MVEQAEARRKQADGIEVSRLKLTRRQTVLVVDELPINATFVSLALEPLCDVITAYTGTEGLQRALEYQPDLIMLDVHIQGIDGFELCRRLKAHPVTASIPVIFLTELIDEEDEERGLNAGGAIDYILKPFSIPILRARVRNHLELNQQRKLLERLSQLDGLTGIANRREFDQSLQREWQRMLELQESLAVLMIDVDVFKLYNDNCGHQAGDECLKWIAQAISDTMQRQGDLATRYGGEEFACILPNTDIEGAVHLAESIRLAVEGLAIMHPASPVHASVTVSVGVAAMVPTAASNPMLLLGMADRRLYVAKQSGRNQVCGSD
ncbi:diguanylate cyclase [Alcaligenaceae bacterium]|nr:diguanylate cyclase [Alcaligenaceae bacterium]